MILYTEGSTDAQASEAEKVMHILCAAYPGHPWAVRVDRGIIFIRHLAFGYNYGMNLKTREVDHDAAVLRRKIIIFAGEWLERAGMVRGRHDADQDIEHLEGALEKHQPHQPLPDDVKLVMPDKSTPLRTEPLPQTAKDG